MKTTNISHGILQATGSQNNYKKFSQAILNLKFIKKRFRKVLLGLLTIRLGVHLNNCIKKLLIY